MLLQDSFFTIQSINATAGIATASIEINAVHKIFEGHFPGQPVVPGVCMMQMVKELLENVLEKEIRLVKADHLKFLSVINPVENNIAQIELKYALQESNDIHLTATITK